MQVGVVKSFLSKADIYVKKHRRARLKELTNADKRKEVHKS